MIRLEFKTFSPKLESESSTRDSVERRARSLNLLLILSPTVVDHKVANSMSKCGRKADRARKCSTVEGRDYTSIGMEGVAKEREERVCRKGQLPPTPLAGCDGQFKTCLPIRSYRRRALQCGQLGLKSMCLVNTCRFRDRPPIVFPHFGH